jgi:hypothetical protein
VKWYGENYDNSVEIGSGVTENDAAFIMTILAVEVDYRVKKRRSFDRNAYISPPM